MRLYGSSAPETGAASVGQLAIALRPARIAAVYEISSLGLRPGMSCGFAVSLAPPNRRASRRGSAACAAIGGQPHDASTATLATSTDTTADLEITISSVSEQA